MTTDRAAVGWIAALAAVGVVALSKRSAASSSSPAPFSGMKIIRGQRVLVHVPKGARGGRVVLYFHGHDQTIEDLETSLVPTLDTAKRPAILLVPQLGPKSEPGALADPGGMDALVRGGWFGKADLSTRSIDVLAHSGGYLAAATAIAQLPGLRSVGLLDALYGRLETFEAFALRPQTRHLVNVYGPSTADSSKALAAHVAGKTPSTIDEEPTSTPSPTAMRKFKVTTFATSVFHADVPKVYGAAMIDAFSA